MGMQSPKPIASTDHALRARGPASLKGRSYVRPYTQFWRGGLYRFRADDPGFKPFRLR
jgi:hypothetical protein